MRFTHSPQTNPLGTTTITTTATTTTTTAIIATTATATTTTTNDNRVTEGKMYAIVAGDALRWFGRRFVKDPEGSKRGLEKGVSEL